MNLAVHLTFIGLKIAKTVRWRKLSLKFKKARNTSHNVVEPFGPPLQFHFQYSQNSRTRRLVWPMQPNIWVLPKKRWRCTIVLPLIFLSRLQTQ